MMKHSKLSFFFYIDTYWIPGCFPPFIWSTWKRTSDYTNDNQEGYNSKIDKELKQHNPSPGLLLVFIRKQIILAKVTATSSQVGNPDIW